MNEARQQMLKWQEQGLIDNSNIEQALELGGGKNTSAQWFTYIKTMMLWLGVLALASGIIFFFAYNWDDISDFTKFAIVQGLIVVAFIAYTQTRRFSIASTSTLFFMTMLFGALFALFGQTYQTGKDPWQLFLIWTLFTTPLAFASRSSGMWLIWLGLANLTLSLYSDVHRTFWGFWLFSREHLMFVFALLNMTAGLFFELLHKSKAPLLFNRIAAQTALVAAMVCFSFLSLYFIDNPKRYYQEFLLFLLWMPAIYYFYRVKTLDVLIMASWAVATAVFALGLIAKAINDDLDGLAFLLFGLLIIGASTAIIKWLIYLLRESRATEENSHE